MRVLMLVWTAVAGDARVEREAATLAASGHEVHVIGRSVPDSYQPPPGVTVSSVGGTAGRSAERGPAGAAERAVRWALLPTVVARRHEAWVRGAATLAAEREFDAVHAHDFTALPLGAHLAATRGVPLVYDTHEFWSGRPRLSRPTPLRGARERTIERRLGAQAAAVLTVSDSVAEMLRAAYGWAHVHVVRNSFPMVDAGPSPAAVTGAVYAGRIAPYRELETVVAAADALAPLPVTLVGPADPAYLARLHVGRVTVRDALPLDDAVELLRCAGLALVTHSDRWPNHRAALPNKLFLAARAGVPVVATDVAELRRVVTTHRLGRLYRPGDPTDLAAAVREVAADYASYAANVVAARPALSWSRDAEVLLAVYAGLATREDR